MDLRPAFQIQTVIKAMTDVVLPALDKNNKLAQEQAQLAIGMLNLVLERLPLWYRFDCDELSRFLALAETLQNQANDLTVAKGALLDELGASIEAGRDVLRRAKAEPRELELANFHLREKIGALITELYAQPDTMDLRATGAAVLAHAKEQLLRERTWLVAQGWEADPSSLPPIESLIGTGSCV